MALYTCSTCGMSVNTTCGACGADLVDASITKDDGSSVEISQCPNGHGKIKSPMCCGSDMSCTI
jgi:DNA-directed RNA polymerase subunit RPC12/RpoP